LNTLFHVGDFRKLFMPDFGLKRTAAVRMIVYNFFDVGRFWLRSDSVVPFKHLLVE
jgi:hypothetical protein